MDCCSPRPKEAPKKEHKAAYRTEQTAGEEKAEMSCCAGKNADAKDAPENRTARIVMALVILAVLLGGLFLMILR